MNRTTIIMLVLALASAGAAYAARPAALEAVSRDDTGTLLAPDFADPGQAASLEVEAWNSSAATLGSFRVELQDGRWVIPSHHDYPADATERMGRAAASFVGVTRDMVRSEAPADHADFGVEDPRSPEASDGGRGVRVTMRDAGGNPLVDVIVGKVDPERDGYRFWRFPDEARVYSSKLALDVSTRFEDWIEKDLLRIDADDVDGIISDPYRVDEETGRVEGNDAITFVRGELAAMVEELEQAGDGDAAEATDPEPEPEALPADAGWRAGPGVALPEGKVIDPDVIDDVVRAVDELQIVGVRPRPMPLTLEALQGKGFFVNSEQRLFGNEGELTVVNDDGVTYTLYFGEVTREAGLALTAGVEAEGDDADAGANAMASRYMFVSIGYDPGMDRTSADAPEGEARGEKRAEELAARFERWFFVISDESFQAIHRSKASFLRDAPEPSEQSG